MKKIIILLALLILPIATLADSSQDSQSVKKKAVYFYSESCLHCAQVNTYFQEQNIYDKYDIQKMEVSDPENLKYLNEFFDAFNIPAENRGYPVIFVGGKMIFGSQAITDSFISVIEQVDATEFPTPEKIIQGSSEQKVLPPVTKKSIPIFLLISAALVDASNPCALAVLILLLATVIAAKGRNQALFSGLLFSLAIFSSYFLMGLGLYKAITVFSLPKFISLGIGMLSILIGLANMKDFFWYGKYFVMEVPMSWRPRMQAILKKVSSPLGAFGAGFVVSLFLVPCSSGPYVVILGLLAEKVDTTKTMLLLFLYNLIFVLPMIVITLAMYFGSRMGNLEHWRQKNLRILHLIAGSIMLFIGGYLIYNWL